MIFIALPMWTLLVFQEYPEIKIFFKYKYAQQRESTETSKGLFSCAF